MKPTASSSGVPPGTTAEPLRSSGGDPAGLRQHDDLARGGAEAPAIAPESRIVYVDNDRY
jgi:hypothetical protein